MKMNIILLCFILNQLAFSNYPEFEIIINNNPYNANLFIHTMHQPSGYMAIIDTNLNFYWSICSGNKGIDFKTNGEFITYFYKDTEENDVSLFANVLEGSIVEIPIRGDPKKRWSLTCSLVMNLAAWYH